MSLYIVRQCGIYCGEILGVFSSKNLALECAISCAKIDVDDYHSFHVTEHKINSPCINKPKFYCPMDGDEVLIAVFRKCSANGFVDISSDFLGE